MSQTVVRIDLYTRIVLTAIAVCLAWICFGGFLKAAPPLRAQSPEIVDVRLRAIERETGARWDPIGIEALSAVPVEILNREAVPVDVRNETVPVDVKNVVVQTGLRPLEKK